MPTSLVSICIPTYNGAQFIAKTMDSALSQTYSNIEIVVSDDASIDMTLSIIALYKEKTKIPINIYHHVPNGIGANWNNTIKQANGEYIKFLFQDDVLLPNCIEDMMNVIESNRSIDLVACKRTFIIEPLYLNWYTKIQIERTKNLQQLLNLSYTNGISFLDSSLFSSDAFFKAPYNKIGEPSVVLFKKSIIDTVGYFNENLKQVLDFEFYYRILKKSKIAILNKELVKFRLHNDQTE